MERAIIELQPHEHSLLVNILAIRRQRPIAYRVLENGCWWCLSHRSNPSGYPQMGYARKQSSVAQYMFIRTTGITPKKGEVIRHTCDHSECINPDHLILGTQKDNFKDYLERGKSAFNTRRKTRKSLKKNPKINKVWNHFAIDGK